MLNSEVTLPAVDDRSLSDLTAARSGPYDGDHCLSYGDSFASVYDMIFPPADGTLVAESLRSWAGDAARTFVELGVGTGRVALPLALTGAEVIGVDTSHALLEIAAARAREHGATLELVRADIRNYTSSVPADVTYCVCGTLSMVLDPLEQQRVIHNAARSTRVGGTVVVETHNPGFVRRLHAADEDIVLHSDVAGLPSGLTTSSHLRASSDIWLLDHEWSHDGIPAQAREFSRLTSPEELDARACSVGLLPVARTGGFGTTSLSSDDPLYLSVFRRV